MNMVTARHEEFKLHVVAITVMNRATTTTRAHKKEVIILHTAMAIFMVNAVVCNMMPEQSSFLPRQKARLFIKIVMKLRMEKLRYIENVNTPNLGPRMGGRCEMKNVVVDKEANGTGGTASAVSGNSPRSATGGASARLIAGSISIRGGLATSVEILNVTNRNAVIVKIGEVGVVAALWFMQIKRHA